MDLQTILDTIPGWLDAGEAQLLHDRASLVGNGCIVEIGSYRGRSTLVLATAARVPVYSIDPYIPSDNEKFGDSDRVVWMRHILDAGVADKVRQINLESAQVAPLWKFPISLLFIDGAHDHLSVTRDLALWFPHVMNNGSIAFHDSDWDGVKATLDIVRQQDWVASVDRVDATTIVRICR